MTQRDSSRGKGYRDREPFWATEPPLLLDRAVPVAAQLPRHRIAVNRGEDRIVAETVGQ